MKKILFVSVFVLFGLSIGLGQSIVVVPTITEADIINASVLVDPFAEKIKYIAPTTFSLRFENINPANIVKLTMVFEAFVTLEDDTKKRGRVRIAYGKTKPFAVTGAFREFTSEDADNPKSDIDFNEKVIDEEMKSDLKKRVLDPSSGGRVPSGVYEVSIRLTVDSINGQVPVNEQAIPPIDRQINITNPTIAVLDVPFSNGYIYPTPFPQFQWTYDTRQVQLSVYELRPEHQSLEDAIGASDPYLNVLINRYDEINSIRIPTNISSFTYPQSSADRFGMKFSGGVRPLERGKMYVVVLDGIRTAFGYDIEPLRTIRSFFIADPQGQVILNILQTTFGGGDHQSIISLIQDQNLQVNANGITLNGVVLSPQDLQKLLVENKNRITTVRFED